MVGQKTAFFLWIALLVALFFLIGNKRPTEEGVGEIRSNSIKLHKDDHSLSLHNGGKKLSSETTIKRFVFIISYQGSRRSVVGTLIDAHPHTLIADRDSSIDPLESLLATGESWKESFFDHLYKTSLRRSTATKPLHRTSGRGNDWQGRYDRYIDVIGEDSEGSLLASYLQNRDEFVKKYKMLKKALSIPVSVIHLLQNPFDIIPTANPILEGNVDYSLAHKLDPNSESKTNILDISGIPLERKIGATFQQFEAMGTLTEDVFGRENVLEVHYCDLVSDPKGTAPKIFEFLELDTMEGLLDACAEMVGDPVSSRPRDSMAWSPELKQAVEKGMLGYGFLDKYSFTSD